MRKKTRAWLITAALLILSGGILFAGVMTALQWDFGKLSTVSYETNTYDVTDAYHHIAVVTDTADIVFVPSENGNTSVVCYETKTVKHAVSVKEDTLVIEMVNTREWYEHIGVNFGTPTVTVAIPKGEYDTLRVKASTSDVTIPKDFAFNTIDVCVSTGDVTNGASSAGGIKIKTSTGDIRVGDVSADTLDLSVSTGHVTATDVRCQRFLSSGDTGDITLTNVVAAQALSIERSTGDVTFDGCDAAELFVKTDTGDIKGNLLSGKMFFVQTDTGDVDVPETTTGGRCEIITNTGDINVKVP